MLTHDDFDFSIREEHGNVPSVDPAFRINNLGCSDGVLIVAEELCRAADAQLATRRELVNVVIHRWAAHELGL